MNDYMFTCVKHEMKHGCLLLSVGWQMFTSLACLQDGTVHDYTFDQEACDWVHWMKTVPPQELSPSLSFNEIIVQTIDTVRYSYLMRLLVTHSHHTLFTGTQTCAHQLPAAAF